MDITRLSAALNKWRINKTMLADMLGIDKGTLSAILSGRKYYDFTQQQEEAMRAILTEMGKDLINTAENNSDEFL